MNLLNNPENAIKFIISVEKTQCQISNPKPLLETSHCLRMKHLLYAFDVTQEEINIDCS